jgi:hypothetical protein
MLSSIVIGGGPGGLGPLIWAAQTGVLPDWLSQGVAIVDRQDNLGGTLGRYAINSDSLGGAYLECLEAAGTPEEMRSLQDDPLALEMEVYRDGYPPLVLVDRFMHRLGAVIEGMLAAYPACAFYRGTQARSLHLDADGTVEVRVGDLNGGHHLVKARTAVIALGGQQDWINSPLPNGLTLGAFRLHKVMPSDRLLSHVGLAQAAQLLRADTGRPIAILGGSHSAYAAAWTLVNLLPADALGSRQIMILQRRPPRIFYPSRAAAMEDNYPVAPGDICPRTQRVNRLGGLRGDGREMWRRIAGRPGAPAEPRVTAHPLAQFSSERLRTTLEEAALIVPAFGYRSATLPVYDHRDQRLSLSADLGERSVAQDCRLLLADGGTVRNVFGIGLGTGYRPSGSMGGEPNLSGQANSLWLYQNDIGAVIHRGVQELLREPEPATVARPRPALAGWPIPATVPRSAR